ncbi:MAG: dihydropteroate synthase [Planctomycetia bacterium]|nr:dihydropteroate synthase [Planctomycetia bacterium]
MMASKPRFLKTFRRTISLEKPLWMAIVNVTPDSFSDGGGENRVEYAIQLWRDGADILDIGGESTRPGSHPVSPAEEIRRVAPVIQGIYEYFEKNALEPPPLSIDTYHPETARLATALGVEILNDITALQNPQMAEWALEQGLAVCFMHMQGRPQTMQQNPHYHNVFDEVYTFLRQRRDALLEMGFQPSQLLADIGIGFGKTMEQNWELLFHIDQFQALNLPLLVGHSRKRFLKGIGTYFPETFSRDVPETLADRDRATDWVSRMLVEQGVEVLRTHTRPWFKKE